MNENGGERRHGCFTSRVVDGGYSVPWFRIDCDVPFDSTTDCSAYLNITNERGHGTIMITGSRKARRVAAAE
ncbi:MAG: hypothetical protein WCE81_02785 [Halobacteriota archaeon]